MQYGFSIIRMEKEEIGVLRMDIVICDDEQQQIDRIQHLVEAMVPSDTPIHCYTNSIKMLAQLERFEGDTIFFMDIMIDKESGIQTAQYINQRLAHAAIIFVTSFLDKASDVYDTRHCYFIYKPELEKRFSISLAKAIRDLSERKQVLALHEKNRELLLSFTEIYFIERSLRNTIVFMEHEKFMVADKLEDLKEKLPPYFIKTHRSFLVNLRQVREYHRIEFILKNGDVVPISRSHSEEVRRQFHQFLMHT